MLLGRLAVCLAGSLADMSAHTHFTFMDAIVVCFLLFCWWYTMCNTDDNDSYPFLSGVLV